MEVEPVHQRRRPGRSTRYHCAEEARASRPGSSRAGSILSVGTGLPRGERPRPQTKIVGSTPSARRTRPRGTLPQRAAETFWPRDVLRIREQARVALVHDDVLAHLRIRLREARHPRREPRGVGRARERGRVARVDVEGDVDAGRCGRRRARRARKLGFVAVEARSADVSSQRSVIVSEVMPTLRRVVQNGPSPFSYLPASSLTPHTIVVGRRRAAAPAEGGDAAPRVLQDVHVAVEVVRGSDGPTSVARGARAASTSFGRPRSGPDRRPEAPSRPRSRRSRAAPHASSSCRVLSAMQTHRRRPRQQADPLVQLARARRAAESGSARRRRRPSRPPCGRARSRAAPTRGSARA